jgi:hypothetical protein
MSAEPAESWEGCKDMARPSLAPPRAYFVFLVGVQEQSVLQPEVLGRMARQRKMPAVRTTMTMATPLCQSIAFIDIS